MSRDRPQVFLCPHCATPITRLRVDFEFTAEVEGHDDDGELGYVRCHRCSRPIVFDPRHPAGTARSPTEAETAAIRANGGK